MKSSGQVREEILDAAARLFARYGFKKTSIDDVAAAARIGKGTVYLHFQSKDEMFAEVVRRVSDRLLDALVAAVEGAQSPDAKVRAFVETMQNAIARLADAHLEEGTLVELLPVAAAYRQAHESQEHAVLAGVLREGNASGAFDVADPERLATGILACVTALETSTIVKRDDAAVRAGVDELLTVLLRGLGPVRPAHPSHSNEAAVRGTNPHEVNES